MNLWYILICFEESDGSLESIKWFESYGFTKLNAIIKDNLIINKNIFWIRTDFFGFILYLQPK